MSATDMKGVLDRAATSPDPVIRGVGIEYMKAIQVVERYKPFLEMYAGGLSILAVTPVPVADTAPTVREPAAPVAPRVNGKEFAVRIVALLRERGSPAHFQELFDLYSGRYGSEIKAETFRQKLVRFECAAQIHSVDGRGYWPKGDPLPDVA